MRYWVIVIFLTHAFGYTTLFASTSPPLLHSPFGLYIQIWNIRPLHTHTRTHTCRRRRESLLAVLISQCWCYLPKEYPKHRQFNPLTSLLKFYLFLDKQKYLPVGKDLLHCKPICFNIFLDLSSNLLILVKVLALFFKVMIQDKTKTSVCYSLTAMTYVIPFQF